MQLEVIFTFESEPQKIEVYPFVPQLLEDKKVFFEFVTSLLTGEEKETLVKISCCIYFAIGLNLPEDHWYTKENGKFYRDEIVDLMREIWAITSLTAYK